MNDYKLISSNIAPSCYFRSSTKPPHHKMLINLIEKCNFKCVHCFVSAESSGKSIPFNNFKEKIIPKLNKFNVIKVTLTGGEPFLHENIIEIIKLLSDEKIQVGICTNGSIMTDQDINEIEKIENLHINVSLHGFNSNSHDKFCGHTGAFNKVKKTIQSLGKIKKLQGILVTPNIFTTINEYTELCHFAKKNNAKYVLMNPLAKLGRGIDGISKYSVSKDFLEQIKKETRVIDFEIVYIRFPNNDLPLLSCQMGNILYTYTNGDITICPYLHFASKTSVSRYPSSDFVIGNIYTEFNIEEKIANMRDKYIVKNKIKCNSCHIESICGKGCPAAIIGSGGKFEDLDYELCYKTEKGV